MNNTEQPLYKQLNEQRTQGEWKLARNLHGNICLFEGQNEDMMDTLICKMQGTNILDQVKANAQYTALAVNNLHHLAEALEAIISACSHEEWAIYLNDELTRAKQALNRIS